MTVHLHIAVRCARRLVLLTAAAVATGCVYRPDIQQGNLLTMEDVDQVTVGMTRSQVRYLLGTPMVSDPFAPQRWDYVYRRTHGRDRKVDTAHFIVRFDGDKVTAVDRVHLPDPLAKAEKGKKKKQKSAAEDAPAANDDVSSSPVTPQTPPPDTVPPGIG
jgi:outer membrane protein assembly factor BamE